MVLGLPAIGGLQCLGLSKEDLGWITNAPIYGRKPWNSNFQIDFEHVVNNRWMDVGNS